MSGFPVEFLKGHDNSADGFRAICYIKIPMWLHRKIMCPHKVTKQEHEKVLFEVIEETEKAYKILYCKDTSCSYDFCRPTWFVDYVPKSVVELVRTDIEEYEKDEYNYYAKKLGWDIRK